MLHKRDLSITLCERECVSMLCSRRGHLHWNPLVLTKWFTTLWWSHGVWVAPCPWSHVVQSKIVEECSGIYQEVLSSTTIGKSADDLLLVSDSPESYTFHLLIWSLIIAHLDQFACILAACPALKTLLRFWTFCSGWKIMSPDLGHIQHALSRSTETLKLMETLVLSGCTSEEGKKVNVGSLI